MTTTPTQNPVPSESPSDLKFNAGKIDEFVTSMVNAYVDRFGKEHYTIEGLKNIALQQIYDLGWNPVGTFQDGTTVNGPGDIVQDESTGVWYRWDDISSLPKTIPSGSTPSSSGGTGEGKWLAVDVSDVLRKDLAKSTGASMIGSSDGRTVQEFLIANDSAEFRAKNIAKLASVNYKIRKKTGISVLFQGDSITAGFDQTSTDIVPPDNGDWATHASKTYPQRFTEFMYEQSGVIVTPVIRAISGYTAQRGYENAGWQSNPNCDLVFLMYGINDSAGVDGTTHESYMEYMEKLIRRFINWGAGVVVLTCAAGGQGANNPEFQIWSQQAKNMALVYGCKYMDAHEVHYNRWYGSVQSNDLHFNSVGYAKIGESLVSMCLSGGLLDSYEPVRNEIQFWPGSTHKSIGFCNPDGNFSTNYNANSYINPGIIGAMPSATRCVISFNFYQDCEALEFDLVGYWPDNELNIITGNWYTGSVPYYSLSYQMNNVRSPKGVNNTSFNSSKLLRKDGGSRDGQPKFVGTLFGRGWKTITIYTPLNGSGTQNAYIQMLELRPVSARKANTRRQDAQLGNVGVVRAMLPEPVGGLPAAVPLSSVTVPLPDSLNGYINDNKTNFYDCGVAQFIIKSAGGDLWH